MTDTIKNENRVRKYLIRTLADPVLLYTVLAMMAIMYHYRSSLAFAYGAAAYIIGWLVFRVFDYVNKHHIIGFLICVILYIGFGYAASYAMKAGAEGYSISWGLWFFTPQDALKYNKWYTIAVFILFLIFMLSVIYYFTRVRYRIFMNFLVFIIPFTIYGKEYEKMPTGYIIALAVGYALMMVMFRQLNETDKVRIVEKSEVWKSIAVFAVLFALCSTLTPKPAVEANRTYLEMLIDADGFTDRLVKMIERFRDSSSGDQFRGRISEVPVYYMEGGEPMRLKTATFTSYDYSKDEWRVSDIDSYYEECDDLPIGFYDGRCIAEAVLRAAECDSDFAEKYGLTEYIGSDLTFPELREAVLHSVTEGETIPLPQGVMSLTKSTFRRTLDLTRSEALLTDEGARYGYDMFTFEYMPEGFFLDDENCRIVDAVGKVSKYEDMLSDAYDILDDEEEQELADTLLESYLYYDEYTSDLLDYGKKPSIRILANEITEGCETDYDKARAIEMYFLQGGFVYDLNYKKSTGENAENFLFDTKRGVCFEYATAMTLLARAAGIPARFCEGYLMQNEWEGKDSLKRSFKGYSISPRDGHAFPELYIKGYGWVTFEPTRSGGDEAADTEKNNTATNLLSRAGLMLLAAALFMLLLIIVMPALTHKVFTFINNRRAPDKAVAAVMHRLCRIYGIANVNTANEAAAVIKAASGADISAAAGLFDKLSYGGAAMSEDDRTKAMDDYYAAYTALAESKKNRRKKAKEA